MVSTRSKKSSDTTGFPPRSPQAHPRRTNAAASVSSRRSRAASPSASSVASSFATETEAYSGGDTDSEDDKPPQDIESFQPFQPPPSVKVSAGASVTSTGSKRLKLDKSIEKQVLRDIEATGGIYFFEQGQNQALSILLANPEHSLLYGPKRGEDIRKKIGRRVRYLKKLPQSEYNKVCTSLGVEPVKYTKAQLEIISNTVGLTKTSRPKTSRPKSIVKKEDEDVSDLEDNSVFPDPILSSSSSVKPDKAKSSSRNSLKSRSSVKSEVQSLKSPQVSLRGSDRNVAAAAVSPAPKMNSSPRRSVGPDDEWVDIWLDPAKPFDNSQGIILSSFVGLDWNGNDYDGVTILVQGDPRDVSADRFKLEVFDPPSRAEHVELSKPCNKFKLTMPLVPAGLYMDREDLIENEGTPEVIKKSLIVTMQSVKDLPDGQNKKEFVIGFKGGKRMKLTDKPFLAPDDPGDSLVIKPFHPISFYNTGHPDYDENTGKTKPLENLGTFVSWRLIDTGSKRKMKDDAKKGPVGKEGVAAAIAAARAKRQKTADASMPKQEHVEHSQHHAAKKSASPKAMDVEGLEEQMMASMGASSNAEALAGFEISKEGWARVSQLLELYIREHGGEHDVMALYDLSKQTTIQHCLDNNLGPDAVEPLLVEYVNGEVRKAAQLKEQEKTGKQTTLAKAAMQESRSKLFKPLASESARDARGAASDRTRQMRREQAVNKARSKAGEPLQMESLLTESVNEAQDVLKQVGGNGDY